MRVLVVDNSAFMCLAVSSMLSSDPDIEVAGIARNGTEGLERAKKLKPDVITLDIEMPEMDGLTALRRIMREAPTHVVMVSSLTTEGSVASLQALRLGAADVVAKDQSQISPSIDNMREKLVTTVKALGGSDRFKKNG
jgi:two-component system chemotaxis response regulator CheB